MTIKIDKNRCNGCPGLEEGRCERICPGDLIRRRNNKAEIDYPEDCWDCAACVKACPLNAISIYLPKEIGGKGAKMSAKIKKDEIIWIFSDLKDGKCKYKMSR